MSEVVQATGAVASDVVSGLKNQPMMLAIVVLNVIGIGIAGWIGLKFLEQAERGDAADRQVMRDILENNREGFERFLDLCFPDGLRRAPRSKREDREDRATIGGPR